MPDTEKLAPLETFDPTAFVSSDAGEQSVCDFVLALAVIYNDLKDILWLSVLHQNNPPAIPRSYSKDWGQYEGLRMHVIRRLHAVLFETLYLIQQRRRDLKHPLFQSAIQTLHKMEKDAWRKLEEAAISEQSSDDEFVEFLRRIRNKLSSHYSDARTIGAGYRKAFFDARGQKLMEAFISRGSSMRSSRFYFADAASYGVIEAAVQGKEAEYRRKIDEFTGRINRSLYHIVERFVQTVRLKPYSTYRPSREV